MTITFVDPFVHLVTKVREYFTAHAVTATVTAGFKERQRQDTQGPGRANRVVFLPGDPSGKGGSLAFGVRSPGLREVFGADGKRAATWRNLGDWDRVLGVSVWAYDPDAATDELVQIAACTDLAIWTRRAVDSVGMADLVWSEATWTVPKTRSFGQELLIGLTLRQPMPDVPKDVGRPGFTLTKQG